MLQRALPDSPRETATRLLDPRAASPERHAALVELVYDELRGLARHLLHQERSSHTLQPTALVHEAWLRLIDCSQLVEPDREGAKRTFFALAARAMRQVLVDHARRQGAQKRGGSREQVDLPESIEGPASAAELIDLEAALGELEQRYPRVGRVAELRVFGGLTLHEVAAALGISRTTVDGDWALARALLSAKLRSGD